MVIIPKICGTCAGSNNAITLVHKAIQENKDKKIVIYKEILHNKRVIADLEKVGASCIEDIKDLNNEFVVVIRAHGEGKETYNYLNNKKIKIVDATCPNVKKIHQIIDEKYNQGYSIIIIGKKIKDNVYHPEVEGSNGWCDNKAIIIDSKEDIENIKDLNDNVLIICQTTANIDKVNEYSQLIIKKFKNKNIEFVNSICNATKLIQKYSIQVAKDVELMFIIGGKNSSNTNELYEKCNQYTKCIKISDKEELIDYLKDSEITNNTIIGLTGGASTPQYEIYELKEIIDNYQKTV